MSTLEKIRNRTGLLLIGLGLAMVAFVVDFNSLGNVFFGGNIETTAGEVYGHNVDRMEYERKVREAIQQSEAQGRPVDDNARNQIRNQVWGQMVNEIVLNGQYDELGLAVTDYEALDLVYGDYPSEQVKGFPIFQDSITKQYDPVVARERFQMLEENNPEQADGLKDYLANERMGQKYFNMITQSVFVTDLESKRDYVDENKKVEFDFVAKKYFEIPDSVVTISEKDYQNYYEEHKSDPQYFNKVESRKMDYVIFSIEPTEEDFERVKENISELKEEFSKVENDSMFVVRRSSNESYQLYNFGDRELPSVNPEIDGQIMVADSSDVVGPWRHGMAMRIGKIKNKKGAEKAFVKQIFFRSLEDDPAVKKEADSVLRLIRNNGNFDEMNFLYNQDEAAKMDGGKTTIGKEDMSRGEEFNNFCFDKAIGSTGVVKGSGGYHIIEITERKQTPDVLILELEVTPSETTRGNAYNLATDFIQNEENFVDLQKTAQENGLIYRSVPPVTLDRPQIQNVEQYKEVVRWAFESEVNEVNKPLEENKQFLIFRLQEINYEGEPSLETLKPRIEAEIRKIKKFEYITAKTKAESLEGVAKDLNGTVANSGQLAFNSPGNNISGGTSDEGGLIGQIFAMEPGVFSGAIQGKNAVYYIQVKSFIDAPESNDPTYNQNKTKLESANKTRFQGGAYNALIEKAEVRDYRVKFE